MSKVYEVELRYAIDGLNDANNIVHELKKNGFKKVEDINQEDIYYTSKYKDFIISEECLRIRTVNGKSEITWKPPSNIHMKESDFFWKEEVDLNIYDQLAVAKYLLLNLGFIEYCTVSKSRTTYLDPLKNVEASIDIVRNAGAFLELELKSDDVELAKVELENIRVKLGLSKDNVSKTPYRDIVKKPITTEKPSC